MSEPLAEPRRMLLATIVLVTLVALVVLLAAGRVVPALAFGALAVVVLVASARPRGA